MDCKAVAAILPRGISEVVSVNGGQNIDDPLNNSVHIIATAAIEAYYPINQSDWKLS